MAAATIRASFANGAGPSLATAETGIAFNRDDTQTGTSAPIPIPTATGTNFSAQKHLCLEVTGTGTTNVTNRTICQSGAPSTGLKLWFQDNPTYIQANNTIGSAGGNIPSAGGSNGATPTTSIGALTAMTTSPQQWDNASVSTGSTGKNGDYVVTILGVDNSYVGGAGTAISLPNILLAYDEA